MLRKLLLLGVVCAAVAICAGCVPDVTHVRGEQTLEVSLSGSLGWSGTGVLPGSGFEVGVASDDRVGKVFGEHFVDGPNGRLRVYVDLKRLGDDLIGVIEVNNPALDSGVSATVSQPAPTLSSTEAFVLAIDATYSSLRSGTLESGAVSFKLSVSTDDNPGEDPEDPMVGDTVTLPAIDPDAPYLAAFEAVAGTVNVFVEAGRTDGLCPVISVLDPTGTVLTKLRGCGLTEFLAPVDGSYQLEATAEGSTVDGASVTLSQPITVGELFVDGPVKQAPTLLPGQQARWVVDVGQSAPVSAAAWSSEGLTTNVDLLDPTFGLIATSGPAQGGRTAIVDPGTPGEYVVSVTNASGKTSVADAISVAVTTAANLGPLGQQPERVPALNPGAGVRWDVDPGGIASRVLVKAAPSTCISMSASAAGALPSPTVRCGEFSLELDEGKKSEVRLFNVGIDHLAAGAVEVSAVPKQLLPAIEVGAPSRSITVGPGSSESLPLAAVAGDNVLVRVEGDCVLVGIEVDAVPEGETETCVEPEVDNGVAALQYLRPAGSPVVSITNFGASSATVELSAHVYVDRAVVQALPTAVIPPLLAGERALVEIGEPALWTATEVVVEPSAVEDCVDVDVIGADGSVVVLGIACGGEAFNGSALTYGTSQLRLSARAGSTSGTVAVRLNRSSAGSSADEQVQRIQPAAARQAVQSFAFDEANENAVNQACKQYLIIGMRGSGQEDGFGPTTWTAVEELRTKLGANNIALIAIERPDYPSAAVPVPSAAQAAGAASSLPFVSDLAVASYFNDWSNYLQSIASGSDALYEMLLRRAHCNETTILVGYSQGAMAVHRTLVDLQTNRQQGVLDRIAAAVLIADGDRHRNDVSFSYGTAKQLTHGITRTFNTGGFRPVVLDNRLGSKVYSVCNIRDMVCDFAVLGAGIGTHTDSYVNSQDVRQAAKDAATKARVRYYNTNGWPVLQSCNTISNSGGAGVTISAHYIAANGGVLRFAYEAYGIPDEFVITYEGRQIYSSGGPVSGYHVADVAFGPGTSTSVTVTVTGPSGTAWDYTISCPNA